MPGSPIEQEARNAANGVYEFDPATIRVGLIAVVVGLLLFGGLGIVASRDKNLSAIDLIFCLLFVTGLLAEPSTHLETFPPHPLRYRRRNCSSREAGQRNWQAAMGRIRQRQRTAKNGSTRSLGQGWHTESPG